ncbi:alpha-amylase [Paenibacillus sp. 7124]|uniref:Alpha-amylase n=1 Tax=Paenibacillus apii TaxID=1850370 RepID=A0A6M1PE71_9BACL|nr:S-layer homology domain-containing protein [Paenibacillus apii]NGM81567.1 alpha-amylase [Paenibacillus apii]
MSTSYGKKRWRWLSVVTAIIMVLQLVSGLVPAAANADTETLAADPLTDQPGGSTKWIVVGIKDWNNSNEEMQMKHLAGGFYVYSIVLPAGHYEFKLVRSGTWTGFDNAGNNFAFDLSASAKVNFYINEELNEARINLPNVQGIQQYTPVLPEAKWPRLVGDLQSVFGEAEWSPGGSRQFFVDYNFDNTVYKIQRTLPVGNYQAKVIFGTDWNSDENYGDNGQNLAINVLDPANVTFSIDYSSGSKNLTHDYVSKNSSFDGKIDKGSVSFDSRSITYKKPFGAIKSGQEDVTLRIAALKGDVQLAKVELTNPDSLSKDFTMNRVTSVGNKDYFEVTIPGSQFSKIGIWGYKFILVDGTAKVEYGDDTSRGGSGSVSDEGAVPYDLTVYDPDYKTPDWMKNAVVYQIFPDRFFDGDKSNNRAKTEDGYRGTNSGQYATDKGGQKLQYFDGGVTNDPTPDQVWGTWGDVPENPDRTTAENQPYYPGAKTDGAWTNEFYGGDIQGIQDKLGYLKSLGINTLYLNPVAWAASNHKYDATDYGHLDPMFGKPVYRTPGDPSSGLDYTATRAESDRVYQAFAKAAREQGMHIINDGVFNHVGDDSIYFDRYSKYPEIGAYEYWAKVYDKMNLGNLSQADAEEAVRTEFTSKINPLTGTHYKYPDDFTYTTWFTITNEKVKNRDDDNKHYKYDAWWGYDSLPAMDAKDPQTAATEFFPADAQAIDGQNEWNNIGYREEVIGHDLGGLSEAGAQKAMESANSQRWMWMGSSGWRLDVAPDVSSGTWKKFREAVKSVEGKTDANGNPIENPVILGEEWGVATRYLLGDQFDSVMNYRFRGAVQSYMISGDANTLNQSLESIREDYPKEAWQAMLNLVDSHDTTRSITKYDHPDYEEEHLVIADDASDRALKLQALTAILQMGYPGAPTIYYGDEVGVTGTKDPDSRRTFPWERIIAGGGEYSATGKYAELFQTYQSAAKVRNDNEVFRTGDLKVAYASGDVIVYARKNDTKGGLVAINRGTEAQTVNADVTGFLPDGLTLADQLGSDATGTVTGGKISLTIPALSGIMMLSTGELSVVPQVTGLHATGGDGSVALSWSAVDGADGYVIYRAAIEGGDLQKVGESDTPSFTDSSVTNGSKYYYTVTAIAGANESDPCDMASATPAFVIDSVTIVQKAEDMTAGVGSATYEIQAEIRIPGLTDVPSSVYQEPEGVIAKLIYYPSAGSPDQALETKLRYKTDNEPSGSKIYWAAFEPIFAGSYTYLAQVSTDNGESFVSSAPETVNVSSDPADTEPPSSPALADIPVESNMTHLTWTLDAADAAGIEIYRKGDGPDYKLIASLDKTVREYKDYTVSNDTAYTYKVAAYDAAYNRSYSEEQAVTPKLVMVDVTLRLHLPDYTPSTDTINIAGDFNGWNAASTPLKVPSGATNRSVVEYNFKMMAGKSIQYKYTRGSWETEAFTSHTRSANDTTDMGNWAYSSTDTNMRLTIANQGGSKQVVDDYVLRWVDMPMIVTLPRTSYGTDIEYATEDSAMNLKAFVPYGVAFTINGQPIPEGAMDAHGNVLLSGIPLTPGVNKFVLHIEPTAETLALPWYTDKGRAGQATKTLTITVTRTGTDNGSGGEPVKPTLTGLSAAAPASSLTVGDTWSTSVQALYSDNSKADVTPQASFESSQPEIASVSAQGVVKALAEGSAAITVRYGGLSKSFTVQVVKKPDGPDNNKPAQLIASAPASSLKAGDTWSTVVQAVYSDGRKVDVTSLSVFESSRPEIASVETGGLVKAISPGTAAITVRYDGLITSFDIQVVPQSTSDGTGGNGGTGGTGSGSGGAGTGQTPPAGTQTVTADQLKPDSSGAASITLDRNAQQLVLPVQSGSAGGVDRIEIKGEQVSLTIPAAVLQSLASLLPAEQLNGAHLALNVGKLDQAAKEVAIKQLSLPTGTSIGLASEVYDFSLQAVTKDGKAISLSEFPKPVELVFHTDAKADPQLTGVYYLNNVGIAEYIGGEWDGGLLKAKVTHFSRYAAMEYVKTYSDVPAGHWANRAVTVLSAKHIVNGVNGSVFAPNQPVTRAEFAAMLVRSLGLTAKGKAPFKDVTGKEWYTDSIAAAYESGIVKGASAGAFNPQQRITREEMASMIIRAYQVKTGQAADSSAKASFTDASGISGWAKNDVSAAVSLSLLKGKDGSRFMPKANTTRAESAQALYNLVSKY